MNLILPDGSIRAIAPAPATVDAALELAGFNPLDVMAVRDGRLLTGDEPVSDDDEIRVIRISHGG